MQEEKLYPPREGYPDTKIIFNIGGQKFVTVASTLSRIPGTRLSNLTPSDPSFDCETKEYFFDHNPHLFSYVLDAFRGGEIHFPQCVCGPAMLAELKFWGLEDSCISACCWKACCEWDEEQKTMATIEKACGSGKAQLARGVPLNSGCWKDRLYAVWLFLDDPHSSLMAKIWAFVYLAVLVISTIVISIETVPSLRVPPRENLEGILGESWKTSNPKIDMYHNSEEHFAIRYIGSFCTLFFLLELMIRFVTCPKKLHFFCSFFNIIDILAILPMFIFNIISLSHPYFWISNNLEMAYNVVGLVAIFRAIRILKIVKLNRGLQVIFLAIRASIREILLLLLLITISTIIFSTAVYYAELHQHPHPGHFSSIPNGFWWSIVTLTTVGYGDVIPTTTWGKCLGSMCAICGILMMALPIPVIANNFHIYYQFSKLKTKLDKRALIRSGQKV